MNQKEVVGKLRQLGWHIEKDDAGEPRCKSKIGGVLIAVTPRLRRLPNGTLLDVNMSVSTELFNVAVAKIMGIKTRNQPIVHTSEQYVFDEVTDQTVKSLSESIIEWAKSQNIQSALEDFEKSLPERPAQRQIFHLASLALSGITKKLEEYKRSFEAGGESKFTPMINIEYLNRAIELSLERH